MISAASKLTDHPRYMIGLLALAVGLAFPYRFDDYFGSNADFFILTEVLAIVFLWVYADRKRLVRQLFWIALILGFVGAASWYLGSSPEPLRFIMMNYMKFLLLCATFATIVRLLRDPVWSDRFMKWVVVPVSVTIVITILLDHGPFEAQFRLWKLHLNNADYAEEFFLSRDVRGVTWQVGSGILVKNFLVPGWSVITIAGGLWLANRKRGSQLGLILIIMGLGAALGAPKRVSVVVITIFLIPNLFPVVKQVATSSMRGVIPIILIGLLAAAPIISLSTDDALSYFRAPLRFTKLGTGLGLGSEEIDGRFKIGFQLPAEAVVEDLGYAAFGRGLLFETSELPKIHSTFLSVLVGFGIIGTLVFLPASARLVRIIFSRRARNSVPWAWRIGVGLIASAAVHGLIDGFFAGFLAFSAWTYFFWLAVGVGLLMRSWDAGVSNEMPVNQTLAISP